jgi:hypothetical protein
MMLLDPVAGWVDHSVISESQASEAHVALPIDAATVGYWRFVNGTQAARTDQVSGIVLGGTSTLAMHAGPGALRGLHVGSGGTSTGSMLTQVTNGSDADPLRLFGAMTVEAIFSPEVFNSLGLFGFSEYTGSIYPTWRSPYMLELYKEPYVESEGTVLRARWQYVDKSFYNIQSTVALSARRSPWYVAMTRTADFARLYIDGDIVAEQASPIMPTIGEWVKAGLGANFVSGGASIYTICVTARAFTPEEMRARYLAGPAKLARFAYRQ